jgi:hypothetical protein
MSIYLFYAIGVSVYLYISEIYDTQFFKNYILCSFLTAFIGGVIFYITDYECRVNFLQNQKIYKLVME